MDRIILFPVIAYNPFQWQIQQQDKCSFPKNLISDYTGIYCCFKGFFGSDNPFLHAQIPYRKQFIHWFIKQDKHYESTNISDCTESSHKKERNRTKRLIKTHCYNKQNTEEQYRFPNCLYAFISCWGKPIDT